MLKKNLKNLQKLKKEKKLNKKKALQLTVSFFLNKINKKRCNTAELIINIDSIKANILDIKSKLKNSQKYCLVAKANAYGLGDKKVCKFVEDEVDFFAVSSAEEFFRIKKITNKKIILLAPVYENITKLAQNEAIFCVTNFESFNKIKQAATKNKNLKFFIQIAVNTGMNRFGFCDEKEIIKLSKEIKKLQNISIFGVFSHYYAAKNKLYAKTQLNRFLKFKNIFEKIYVKNKIIYHIAATDAANEFDEFDMIRVGLGNFIDSKFNTIKLTAKIIDFQNLKKGESAGYNRQFVAKKDTKLAIVSIGYGDGLFRNIVQRGYVLINNNFCKIVAVCMDSILVDVSNLECKICDNVTLIGRNCDKQIFVCDLARWCDTIEYEILTHLTKRVKRKYKEDETYANNNREVSCEKAFGS